MGIKPLTNENLVLVIEQQAANIKIRTQGETFKIVVTSQISMYILLGAVVFIAPNFSNTLAGASISKATTTLLFVVGACFGLVQSIPILANANAAANRIDRLETELAAASSEIQLRTVTAPIGFQRIDVRDIVFRYVDKLSDTIFQIGPIDFTLSRGDLVFITGGNGSGKSTFLRVLAGLYAPSSGEITLDGVRIGNETRDQYRALMSAIFFDYHLFRRLYGISDAEAAEVDRLLGLFRLTNATNFSKGEFGTLDLSSGQSRRLALVVSLLERRPVLLLDEWTAEQDPEFRRKFYDELLPELVQAGATLVVVTHDERYLQQLNLRARKVRMDEGRIIEQRLTRAADDECSRN